MIIALTGQKGGIGKSTTAICLAARALEQGRKVLLVDADPQGTVRTWADVAREQGHSAPDVSVFGATMHRQEELPKAAESYDVTIVDCPPRHGDVQRSALMISDLAILPCGPTAADAWALTSSLEVLRSARALRPELDAAVLITRKQRSTALGKAARPLLETSGLEVLSTELGLRVAYQEAIAAGLGVTSFSRRDAAAREVRSLFQELEDRIHGQETSRGFAPQSAVA